MAFQEQPVQVRQQIIAGNGADLSILKSCPIQNCTGLGGATLRIHSAGIGNNLELWLFLPKRNEPLQDIEKVAGKTPFWVALLLQRENGHREFGQVFECEIIKPAMLGEANRGIDIIAPEAATIANAN